MLFSHVGLPFDSPYKSIMRLSHQMCRNEHLLFLHLRSSEHSGKCVLHGPTSLCYVRTHQHLWTEISFISSGSIPPNSTLHFEVVLDDAWISPFKYETTFKPEGCDKNMRKTALGDRISIHYNGSIDRNSSAVFYETWVLRNF